MARLAIAALLLVGVSAAAANDHAEARFKGTGKADRIRILNVTCEQSGTRGAAVIAFDIAWNHSWRAAWTVDEDEHGGTGTLSVENWDAAWVFVKIRKPGVGDWSQATLSHTRSHHTVPAGAALDVALSNDGTTGAGVFIYRDAVGHGANHWKGVSLRWMHAADGIPDLSKVMTANEKLTHWLAGAEAKPEIGQAGGRGDLNLASGRDALESLLLGDDRVEIQVHAIMMVSVPEGPFWAGDGATPVAAGSSFWAVSSNDWEWAPLGKSEDSVAGQFSAGASSRPFRITGESEMTIGGEATTVLNNNDGIGMGLIDDFNCDRPRTLPAAFPKGYGAFYCMKHEITQGEYVAFLNTIANPGARLFKPDPLTHHFRYKIASDGVPLMTSLPDVACNYLDLGDALAFAAWAGLRPMTELEYEKACRGPLKPMTNECAWGTDRVAGMDEGSGGYTLRSAGTPDEAVVWSGRNGPDATYGNALWDGSAGTIPETARGPLRVGIFATPESDRVRAGASYWGIMELSGNLAELVVTVGSPAGRGFAGTHGNGTPAAPDGWSFTGRKEGGETYHSSGIGSRGGSDKSIRTSSRRNAVVAGHQRSNSIGFRAVRTAPQPAGK